MTLHRVLRSSRSILFYVFTIAIASSYGVAEGTRTWEQSKFDELVKGTSTGVAIRSAGGLELAPSFKLLYATPSTYIWAVAADDAGILPDAQLSSNVPRLNSSINFTGTVSFNPANGSPFSITGGSSNKLVKGLNADKLGGKDSTSFVLKTGDTMTGPLNLPTNGFAVGADQLVVANGRVGIGTTSPTGILDVRPAEATGGAGQSIIIKAQRGASNNVGGNLLLSSGDNGVDSANGHIAFGIGGAVSGSIFSVNENIFKSE